MLLMFSYIRVFMRVLRRISVHVRVDESRNERWKKNGKKFRAFNYN